MKLVHTKKISLKKSKQMLVVLIFLAFLIGLVVSVVIFNMVERGKDQKVEITFTDPHQAVIFWKSEGSTLGYVQFKNSSGKKERVEQTSSTPGEIHAVIVDDVPIDGLKLTIHNQSDSLFYLPKSINIRYDSSLPE